jgi:hypothetical protein
MSKANVMSEPKSKQYLADLEAVDTSRSAPAPANPPERIEDEEVVAPAVVIEGRALARPGRGVDLQALRAALPKKEAPVQQPVRIPPSLKEDLTLICFALGKTKNDFIVDILRKEVAREKKRMGLD